MKVGKRNISICKQIFHILYHLMQFKKLGTLGIGTLRKQCWGWETGRGAGKGGNDLLAANSITTVEDHFSQ